MKLKKNQKLLFIGDSITECSRVPGGWEEWAISLGRGFVAHADALLRAAHPELDLRTINQGVGGHTVRDLKTRWQRDVLDQKPDWLSIMVGINEVWLQIHTPWQKESHILVDEYERTLNELVTQTLPQLAGLVLMSPFYVEPDKNDAMRAMTDRYTAAVKRVAQKHNAIFVDTQAVFDRLLEHTNSARLARDRVHPQQPGHMALALAFLDGIGFKR